MGKMDGACAPGNRLAGSVSRSDREGYACATRNGLVASGEKAGGEREV